MSENPYTAPLHPQPESARSKRVRFRTHAWGAVSLLLATFSAYVWMSIPSQHPAYGGADPLVLFVVLTTLVAACALAALLQIAGALRSHSLLPLVYAVPVAGFACYIGFQIVRMLS